MGLPVARLTDSVTGVSVHHGLVLGVPTPTPVPVTGALAVNPPETLTGVPFLVGGSLVAVEGATGPHAPLCVPPLGLPPAGVPSVDPPPPSFKASNSNVSAPFLINGKRPLVATSVTQHCYDTGPAPTNLLSVGTITSGSPLLML